MLQYCSCLDKLVWSKGGTLDEKGVMGVMGVYSGKKGNMRVTANCFLNMHCIIKRNGIDIFLSFSFIAEHKISRIVT